jgi:hypothetical protein
MICLLKKHLTIAPAMHDSPNWECRVAGEVISDKPVEQVAQMAHVQLCEHLDILYANENMYSLKTCIH